MVTATQFPGLRRERARVARSLERYARNIHRKFGIDHPETMAAYEVAGDAWEETGNSTRSADMRVLAVGYAYGISPPHGIFRKGLTMAAIKEKSKQTGSPYFSRGSSQFFGRERFFGPYVGPGGIFFVQKNRAGVSLKEVRTDWSIDTIGRVDVGTEGVREEARLRARAGYWASLGRTFPTLIDRLHKSVRHG